MLMTEGEKRKRSQGEAGIWREEQIEGTEAVILSPSSHFGLPLPMIPHCMVESLLKSVGPTKVLKRKYMGK